MSQFVWGSIPSIDQLGHIRMSAMNEFLSDYPAGKARGRYIDAELPALPFPDDSFDLALCSHFLFLYARQLGQQFHAAAILEMCRVASECRVFPLPELDGTRSPLVEPVGSVVREYGFDVSIEKSAYHHVSQGETWLSSALQFGEISNSVGFSFYRRLHVQWRLDTARLTQ
jgi:hypothetical protein